MYHCYHHFDFLFASFKFIVITFIRHFVILLVQKNGFLFRNIVQGNYTIKKFYSKLKECNLSKDFPEELLKWLFFRGLSPENMFKVRMDGLLVLALDEIVKRSDNHQLRIMYFALFFV
jgi:hypothetical protein